MYLYVIVAVAAACYFLVKASERPRPGVIVAAIVWLLCAGYEFLIANGTLCDANCNIRVDAIVLWPLVWIATLFGIYAPGQWTVTGKVIGGVSVFFLGSVAALLLYGVLVQRPVAERAAQAKNCGAQSESGRECPPVAPPAGSTTGAK